MKNLYFIGFLISIGLFFLVNICAMRKNAAKPFWEQRRHKTPIRVESLMWAMLFYLVYAVLIAILRYNKW